eukprot:scaffold19421_cov30-Prasinocladus_malaysianus.AAC.2
MEQNAAQHAMDRKRKAQELVTEFGLVELREQHKKRMEAGMSPFETESSKKAWQVIDVLVEMAGVEVAPPPSPLAPPAPPRVREPQPEERRQGEEPRPATEEYLYQRVYQEHWAYQEGWAESQ